MIRMHVPCTQHPRKCYRGAETIMIDSFKKIYNNPKIHRFCLLFPRQAGLTGFKSTQRELPMLHLHHQSLIQIIGIDQTNPLKNEEVHAMINKLRKKKEITFIISGRQDEANNNSKVHISSNIFPGEFQNQLFWLNMNEICFVPFI